MERYFWTFVNLKSGVDLYYYNENTGEFDNFQGNFKNSESANEKAEKEGYQIKPMYWRN